MRGSRFVVNCLVPLVIFISACVPAKRFTDEPINVSRKESLPFLYEVLQSENGRDRVYAIRALSRYHQEEEGLKDVFLDATTDMIWEVRWEGSRALIRMDHKREGIEGLISLISHRSADVKIKSINVIGEQGVAAEFVVPLLETMTTGQALGVERAAKRAINRIAMDVEISKYK